MPFSSYAFRGRRHIRRFTVLLIGFVFMVTTFAVVQLVRTYALGGGGGASWTVEFAKPIAETRPRSSPSSPLVGCVRPRLDVVVVGQDRNPSTAPPLRCDDDEPNWISASNGTFRIEAATRRRHGDILCQYRPILRNGDDFQLTLGKPIKPMINGSRLTADAFEARCVGSNGKVHVGLYSGVASKSAVVERCRARTSTGNKVGNAKDEDVLDILIFGFDSVSRSSWMRQLPETFRFVVEQLGAVVVEGYNIVGDGTPQALLPLLTGRTETELPEARRGFDGANTVDGHPWIWRRLMQERGYATQWGEDGASIGTFTYRMLGFKDQPVDHYLRPFYLAVEKRYSKYKPFCLGSVPRHRNILAWQRDFFHLYGNDSATDGPSSCRRFSFVFHSELSHDSNRLLSLADIDLRNHLSDLEAAGHLRRTAVVLMSDHGPRFDANNARSRRTSTRGKYEERLPFIAVRLPPDYARRHPDRVRHLQRNAAADRLTTAFDLHETLLDFAGLSDGRERRRQRREPEVNGATSTTFLPRRGMSLLDEIPVDRTCAEADVAPHWCTCLQWRTVPVDDVNVQQAVLGVVAAVNRMTEGRRDNCLRLSLDSVQSADMYAADERLLRFQRSADEDGRIPEMLTSLPAVSNGVGIDAVNGTEVLYRVTAKTTPGGALYEATVRLTLGDRKYDVDTRQISRVNEYSKQSHCVADREPHLRAYCYCAKPYEVVSESVDLVGQNTVTGNDTGLGVLTAKDVS